MKKRFLFYLLLWFLGASFLPVHAQSDNHSIDSLWKIVKNSKQDTTVLKSAESLLSTYYRSGDTLKFQEVISSCKPLLDRRNAYVAKIKNYQGYFSFNFRKNPIEGEAYLLDAADIFQQLNDTSALATSYIGLGILFKRSAIYGKALDYYYKSIEHFEQLNDLKGLGNAYNNIANVFSFINDYDGALKYHRLALKYRMEEGTPESINITYLGIGLEYQHMNEFDSAVYYLSKTIEETDKINQQEIKAVAVSSLGILYADSGNFEKALPFYLEALAIRDSIGDEYGVHNSKKNIGELYLQHDFNPIIEKYCRDAYEFAKYNNELMLQSQSCRCLSDYYKRSGNINKAFRYLSEHTELKDSLAANEEKSALISAGIVHRYEKEAAADSVAFAKQKEIDETKIAVRDSQLVAKKQQQWYLGIGILLFFVVALIMYNRFRLIKKQNKIIEVQRELSESQRELLLEKNNEIADSIYYARGIQEAVLPSRSSLRENLKDGFILFKPKDVVSGDFYWLERVGDHIFFAVADCTGHGVPGAMVSVVCSYALSKALLEEQVFDPGKLLDRTREIVIQQFTKSGKIMNDGMDISLVAFHDTNITGDKKQIKWAGANNPMWIFRAAYKEIEVVDANKQPVGNYPKSQPFTTHSIDLNKGDIIYLFSDGFQDQFGGEKGKKFKVKRLKELLLEIHHLSSDQQRDVLDKKFEEWKGDLEQIDDVCMIGVKL
ncbi:MAG: SpoIIE family protein phosphatase [Crocinitomicaceae bacterium]